MWVTGEVNTCKCIKAVSHVKAGMSSAEWLLVRRWKYTSLTQVTKSQKQIPVWE